VIVTVAGGTFEGPKLKGKVAEGASGDWLLVRPDGSMRLDVRITLRTDDGAAILMCYSGLIVGKEGSRAFRTAPLFDTGEARCAWLNDIQAVGIGKYGASGPVYEVYALL